MTTRPGKSARADRPSKQRMLPADRIAYSAITERPPIKLPEGARMAVWVICLESAGLVVRETDAAERPHRLFAHH